MKITIQVMINPYTYQDVDTAIKIAEAALRKGHQVAVFLFCDSVLAINTAVKPIRTDRNIPELMKSLIEKGAEVHICGICFQYRGLSQENIVPGAMLSGLPELASLIYESNRFINLMA
ncbi:DsrE/DsrF/TusD sulfur relay family protein [Kosmotoga sp. DU53]|uniref:DsrE/DsrF/TusD sulfur relay family protein n=1 Tax=Kosmotoga sp. DU53 TaxID=1310160 RepID=UPI0007C54004|nr:DsrE family protein [Kosmotoga sp. DU53]OAA21130.1 sulfur reduction protein DsrE [Kosmotoga sp. DU53]